MKKLSKSYIINLSSDGITVDGIEGSFSSLQLAEAAIEEKESKSNVVDKRFDSEYPVGSIGFEVLHSETIEYRKECLDDFKEEIRQQTMLEMNGGAS